MGYFVGVTLLYTPIGYLSSSFSFFATRKFFDLRNPEILRKRFDDRFVGVPWGLTFFAPPFYLSNKKSHPHLYGDNFKNDGKINFN